MTPSPDDVEAVARAIGDSPGSYVDEAFAAIAALEARGWRAPAPVLSEGRRLDSDLMPAGVQGEGPRMPAVGEVWTRKQDTGMRYEVVRALVGDRVGFIVHRDGWADPVDVEWLISDVLAELTPPATPAQAPTGPSSLPPKGEPRPVVEAVLGTCHRYNWSHGLHDGHECRDWKPTPTFEQFVSRVGEGDLPTSALATAVGPGPGAMDVAGEWLRTDAPVSVESLAATLEAFALKAVEAERLRIEACIKGRRRGWEKGSTGAIALDEMEGDVRDPERGR